MSFPFSFWKWTPLSIPSLVQWYSADDVASGTSNAVDRSGSGRTGTNSNVTIVTNVVTGLPVFRFNGTTSRLSYTSISAGTNFSAFAFLKATSNVTAAGLITWINAAATNQILCGTAGPKLVCFDGTNLPASNVLDDFTTFSLIGVVCTAGTCVFYKNGASIGTGASTVSAITVVDFGAATSFFSAFDVTELVFYTAALNSAQISSVTEYFRSKSPF